MLADWYLLHSLLLLGSFFWVIARLPGFGGVVRGGGRLLVDLLLQLGDGKLHFFQGIDDVGGQIRLIFVDIGDLFLNHVGGSETGLARSECSSLLGLGVFLASKNLDLVPRLFPVRPLLPFAYSCIKVSRLGHCIEYSQRPLGHVGGDRRWCDEG